jgi:hypothetical protein
MGDGEIRSRSDYGMLLGLVDGGLGDSGNIRGAFRS